MFMSGVSSRPRSFFLKLYLRTANSATSARQAATGTVRLTVSAADRTLANFDCGLSVSPAAAALAAAQAVFT